ncbi:general secretion pathway protein GspK [Simiduia aestuariiviva]|uniref:General secretion pathway protein K n=1 Tax=Simiduia aestuariiviva TaxID=1510459 RepID=A0A839UNK4_9GAMM|nr:general secretion pathway protein K [Simiduia aestuariiviva]
MLILALLIVALVATLAVNYASQMMLVQARAENRLYGAQQEVYADSMIDMAARLLKTDAENGELDHLQEDWAFPGGASYSVEGGAISGALADAQAVFNINNLQSPIADKPNPQDPTRFSEAQRRFIRLLQTFDGNQGAGGKAGADRDGRAEADPNAPPPLVIDVNQAIMITEAIADWLDADDEPTGYGGAESLQYQQMGVTWVPPNAAMESIEELKLVQHITPEIYQAIRPYITVLPEANTSLNINTVAEVKLLQTLNAADQLVPLKAEDLGAFGSWRGETGFTASSDLASQPDFQALLNGANLDVAGLSVSTEYFWLTVDVQLAEKVINRRMLLQRKGGDIKVLARFASGQQTAMQVLLQGDADADANGEDDERDGGGRVDGDRGGDRGDGRGDNNSDDKR